MADDLVFPPSDPFDDFGQGVLNEDVLSTDLLNIPQIVPLVVSPNEEKRNFSTSGNSYTPISQLMKQTEQLAATLGQPLRNSAPVEQMNFNTLHQDNLFLNSMQNQMQTSTSNFMSPSGHLPNSQFLVVGGQRIEIPQQTKAVYSSSVITSPVYSLSNEKPMIPNIQPLQSALNSQKVADSSIIDAGTNAAKPLSPSNPSIVKQTQNLAANAGNLTNKHSAGPLSPVGTQNSKLKGQIVKTTDQRLMFVTEMNGKKVGYVIQQTKSPTMPQQPKTNMNHASKGQNSSSNKINSIDTSHQVGVPNILEPNMLNTSTPNVMKSPIYHNIPPNNDLSTSSNSAKVTNIVNPLVSKKEYALSIKDKLMNLPINLKNIKPPLNLPSMNRTSGQKLDVPKTVKVNPVSQVISSSVSDIVQDFDNAFKGEIKPSHDVHVIEDDNDEDDDEDGQEIEFSENDITLDNSESDVTQNITLKSEITKRSISTDDEDDSIPLSQLKQDNGDIGAMEIDSSDRLINRAETGDSIPLSVVAATLKRPADTDNRMKKKKSKSKKKKKDEREPTKPLRAYQLFFRDVHGNVKQNEPELTFGEVSKKIGHMWERLEENKKEVYVERQNTLKIEYDIRLKEYNELIAKETERIALSPSPTTTSISRPPHTDKKEDEVAKKVIKRKNKKKISPVKKTVTIVSEEDLLAQVMNSDEIPIETIQDEPEHLPQVKMKVKVSATVGNTPPSSPSLPSSDSSSDEHQNDDDEEEDNESAITRIRQKAAELKKKIKLEKEAVEKHKEKNKETMKKNKPVKMQVETISEKTVIEEIQPPTKKPPIEKMRKIDKKIAKKEENTAPPPKNSFRIPKKASAENGQPSGPRLCIRESCKRVAKTTRERGSQYCSNDCLVLYCREVFAAWVIDREAEET